EAPVDAPAPMPEVAPPPDLAPPPPDVPATPPPPDRAPPPPDATPPNPMAGLVVFWRFNEGRGVTSADTSGRGHTATLVAGVEWAEGVEGTAVALGGENDHVQLRGPLAAMPAIEAPKSIAFFYFRPGNSGNNGQRTCAALNNPDADSGIQVGIDRGRPALWQWGQNQGFAASPRPAPMGWSHLAYTYDGSRHRLYVDGVLVDSSVQAAQRGRPTNLLLGAPDVEDIDDDELCRGRLDDFRLYDRPLSDAEVAALAKR
ncbi:MAG TPA: LamG domain-containing protein, partial [Polyangia bacterium]